MNNPIILGKANIDKVAIVEVGSLYWRYSNFLIVLVTPIHTTLSLQHYHWYGYAWKVYIVIRFLLIISLKRREYMAARGRVIKTQAIQAKQH